jgi:hypothetical protein
MILLFTFLLILAAIASVSYFATRRKSLPSHPQDSIDSQTNFRSLFAPDEQELQAWQSEQDEKLEAEKREEFRQDLLTRAKSRDFNSLLEAKTLGSSRLYDEVFQVLQGIDSDKLTDFVTRNGLTADADLVELSLKKLSETPTVSNFTKFAHLSALSNSADIFLQAIETTQRLWNENRLNEISNDKIVEILESHYWLLANDARISGTGYLLKEKLASVCREIRGKL